MRVLVTGGTGFVGSHTVKALVDAGHGVRLLVRDPARIAPALDPLGAGPVDHVVGDVLDGNSVRAAMDGCEAVLHAASVYSLDVRRDAEVRRTNLAGARTVLGLAVELGLDPVVHVSSIVAVLPSDSGTVDESTPVGRGGPAYAASKADQEQYARELQDSGAPVVTTLPGGVWGPHDPHDGESVVIARRIVRGLIPFVPSGGFPLVDVRDVAAAHAALMERGQGPRRFVLGGEYIRLWDLIRTVCRTAGVRRARVPIPARMGYAIGLAYARAQPLVPFRLPAEPGTTWIIRCDPRADNRHAEQELGVKFRPAAETVRGQIDWQQAAGRL